MCRIDGDIIGKGPDSIGALREVRSLTLNPAMQAEAVRGNHEAGFLRFLDARATAGPTAGTAAQRDLASLVVASNSLCLHGWV